MLEFKSPKLSDYSSLNRFFCEEYELSCEMNFINIYIWQRVYENKFYMDDKTLFFKSISEDGGYVFSLPYGDFEHGMNLIFEYAKEVGIKPNFWSSQGARLDKFLKKYKNYDLIPERDNFDYVYSREALSQLSGKKYHSKRNHISAFTKKYKWEYESLNDDNKDEFLKFAYKWYTDKDFKNDEGLMAECKALHEILSSDISMDYKGGMIKIDRNIVAATLGSPINSYTFDIHFEKADVDFQAAYAVINKEFALRELGGYKYINREDDLGIEGLRKAKLSYKPEFLVEKFNLIYNGD